MTYKSRFKLADDYLTYTDSVIASIGDPYIQSRYVGFVAVTAVTVYELAIKDIFFEFSDRKHKVLGSVTHSIFDRMNGQIGRDRLVNTHIVRFGDKYVEKFKKKIEIKEKEMLRLKGKSVKESYQNMVTWRNGFVHQGDVPHTATYLEVKDSYSIGQIVIDCLAESMVR